MSWFTSSKKTRSGLQASDLKQGQFVTFEDNESQLRVGLVRDSLPCFFGHCGVHG